MNEDKTLVSRRDFIKTVLAAGATLATLGLPEVNGQGDSIEATVARVEAMSQSELEQQIYHEVPVIPDIESIRHRLREINPVPENSVLMKAGTSVGVGMLESIYGDIDQSAIDLGEENYVVQEVLEHLQVPDGGLDAASVIGSDVVSLRYEPMFCRGPMPCPPNIGVIDAYIDHYNPAVAVNFVGSNMVRNRVSLLEFAQEVDGLIKHYIEKGVIPVMTTFPQPPTVADEAYRNWFFDPVLIVHPGQTQESARAETIQYRSSMLPENALKYNLLIVEIAGRNSIPVINLQRGVVESANNNGTITTEANWPEIDPEHFSSLREPSPLRVPPPGEKFQKGEQAVSYFTTQTLYEIVKEAG